MEDSIVPRVWTLYILLCFSEMSSNVCVFCSRQKLSTFAKSSNCNGCVTRIQAATMSDANNNEQQPQEKELTSQELFEQKLAAQLHLEEERMKSQPQMTMKPRVPYVPRKKTTQAKLIKPATSDVAPKPTPQPSLPQDNDVEMTDATQQLPAPQAAQPTQTTQSEENDAILPDSNDLFEKQLQAALANDPSLASQNDTPMPDVGPAPLTARLRDRVWKVRKDAYEELTKLFMSAQDQSVFAEHVEFVLEVLADKHANVVEAGLDTILAFANKCTHAKQHSEKLILPLAEKLSGKTQKKAADALLMLMEVENPNPIVSQIMTMVDAKVCKTPKTRAGVVNTITLSMRCFGVSNVPTKHILASLVAWFEDTDKHVRAEVAELACEIHKWIKDAIKGHIDSIRPTQRAELETMFAKHGAETPQPTRSLRSTATTNSKHNKNAADEFVVEQKPVEVLSKIPGNMNEELAQPKWQQRKDMLDQIKNLVDKPKLMEGDYSELCALLIRVCFLCFINATIVNGR